MEYFAFACLKAIVIIKFIIFGILKIICLHKGFHLSSLHSVLTSTSLLYEVVAALYACVVDDKSSKNKENDKFLGVHVALLMTSAGSFCKFLAALNTYYKELEEIKKMCYWCTIIEIVLVGLMWYSCCCIAEPKHNSSKTKQTA